MYYLAEYVELYECIQYIDTTRNIDYDLVLKDVAVVRKVKAGSTVKTQ